MNNPKFHIGLSHNENWTNWYCAVGYFIWKGIILNSTVAISLWQVNSPKLHNSKKEKKIKEFKILKKFNFLKDSKSKKYLDFNKIQKLEKNRNFKNFEKI